MPIKWAITYKTTDASSDERLKYILEDQIGDDTEVIPGLHLYPKEDEKTLATLFRAIENIGKEPVLRNKVKVLRLFRITDDANMNRAI